VADVVFVGLSTIDVIYSVDRFPVANEKVAASSQEVFVAARRPMHALRARTWAVRLRW